VFSKIKSRLYAINLPEADDYSQLQIECRLFLPIHGDSEPYENEKQRTPQRAFKFYDTRSKRTQEDRIRTIAFEQAFDACLRITEENHGNAVNTDTKINIRYHRREEEKVARIHNHPKISQRTSLILPERPSPSLPAQ
jgi:hypothetical protein